MKSSILLSILILFAACNKESDFGAKVNPPVLEIPKVPSPVKPEEPIDDKSITESFVQTPQSDKKVDFLWVIDNSGSMSQEQQNLANNFSLFIQDFLTKNVNFRMNITTTDTSSDAQCGQIVPGSDTNLTSEMAKLNEAQFIADFESLIQVGIGGSGNEKGLKASECFIDKFSATHLRTDAYLAVIYVSDEQDQSPEIPEFYLQKLRSIKGDKPNLVKAYSIVNKQEFAYERYDYVSVQSEGSTHDIFSNFSNTLVSIGDQITQLLESFQLKHQPINGSLVVKVNGVVKQLNVDFQLVNQSIKFLEGSVPQAGASIKVSYDF